MYRNLMLVVVATALVGCGTSQKVVLDRDPVDSLIAQSAEGATKALRDLSESAGNSRVVVAQRATPLAPAPPRSAELVGTPRTAPDAQSIASRSGSVAVEVLSSPQALLTTTVAPSTGVVASGGLLSVPPAGLERLVTVRWTGELEELLSKLAQESGWRLAPSTGLRVSPVVISISAENRSIFDVLRDVGAVAGTSAEILVSSSTRTFTVRYPQR
jgi:hypothetical protein